MPTQPLTPQAFATLLLMACLFGGNHVAARVALDHGVDVATAVAVRSLATALFVGALVVLNRVPFKLGARHARVMGVIALLVFVQSLWLYSSVARIPVGLALLAFNTYPLWAAFAAWVIYRHRPERAVLIAMPVILFGLALALDVSGAAAGLSAQAQIGRMGDLPAPARARGADRDAGYPVWPGTRARRVGRGRGPECAGANRPHRVRRGLCGRRRRGVRPGVGSDAA